MSIEKLTKDLENANISLAAEKQKSKEAAAEAKTAKTDLATANGRIQELEAKSAEQADSAEVLAAKNEELAAQITKTETGAKIVKGVFVHGVGKNAKSYCFLPGWTKTRNPFTGKVIASEDALKDTALMNYLVKIKFGGIEVVKK